MVGAGAAADRAGADRARLQRAGRRAAPRLRSGAAAMTLLRIDSLSAATDAGTPILRGVSLDLAPARVLGLIGESGAGKSSIAKAVLGILPRGIRVTGGRIAFDGTDLLTLPRAGL